MAQSRRLRAIERQLRKLDIKKGWDAPAPLNSVLRELSKPNESVRETLLRIAAFGGPEGEGEPVQFDPEGIIKLAARMRIQDHASERLIKWDLYEEQKTLLRESCQELRINVLKSRQIGTSLTGDFFDVIWTAVHAALGGRVTCGLIWDTKDKAWEQIARCKSFLTDLGIPMQRKPSAGCLYISGGSRIKAYTAGALGGTRSLSLQRVHCSELPWWQQASETWAALQPSLGLGAPILIETTMDMSGDPLAATLWRKPSKRKKLFFSFEDHVQYRLPADDLPDHVEEWLRTEGFTNRKAMAWWWDNLEEKLNGDKHKAFREYPQLERHAFSVAEGRWVMKDPDPITPFKVDRYPSKLTENYTWEIEWYVPIEETSGQLVISVDTAEGGGGDNSVILARDKQTRGIICAFWHNYCHRDELGFLAVTVQEQLTAEVRYRRLNQRQYHLVDPVIVCETNGPGKYTFQTIKDLGGTAIPFKTGSDVSGLQHDCLRSAKRDIEAGLAFGPALLGEECQSLHRKIYADGRTGPWVGKKDMMMTLGFSGLHIDKNPYIEPLTEEQKAELARASTVARIRAEEAMPKGRGGW